MLFSFNIQLNFRVPVCLKKYILENHSGLVQNVDTQRRGEFEKIHRRDGVELEIVEL